MWEKLAEVERRYVELESLLSSPETISNRQLFHSCSKEHRDLVGVVEAYRRYQKSKEELKGNVEILELGEDPELSRMAHDEIGRLKKELAVLEDDLKLLLIPKDPNDSKNVIMEFRGGAGGDESSIFAGDLFRMYSYYVEARGWKMEILGTSPGAAGGYKEIIAMVKGQGAWSRLKYESGVHRVQRVPKTEAQGRVHTSTVTLVVLPEAEEVELEILDKDIRIDVYRAGGPGGQSVNTTDSAVRITHIPTGIVVAMQDEKSQGKNRDKGMRVLRSRLLERKRLEQEAQRSADRKGQVGTGDRSEKIRTYNYPQSRVTDHRIGLTLYNLSDIMEGNVDQLVDPLISYHQAEALRGGTASPRPPVATPDDD